MRLDVIMDPTISSNGRRISFHSRASNLVARDSNRLLDVFVRERVNIAGNPRQCPVRREAGEGRCQS